MGLFIWEFGPSQKESSLSNFQLSIFQGYVSFREGRYSEYVYRVISDWFSSLELSFDDLRHRK